MLKKIIFLFFSLSAFLLFSGCNKNNSTPEIISEQKINFTIIDQGTNSGLTVKQNYVILNNNDWQNFWQQLKANYLPIPAMPEIDFNQEMIIAVAMGQKSTGGYTITIKDINKSADALTVISQNTSANGGITTQALTQPYCVVKINKINKEVVFITN